MKLVVCMNCGEFARDTPVIYLGQYFCLHCAILVIIRDSRKVS